MKKLTNLKSHSLILCTTPLQVLISKSIIDKHKEQTFDVVMVTGQDNEKYRYYFEKIKSECNHSFYYIKLNNLKKVINLHFSFIRGLKKHSIGYHYNNIYVASIDEPYFQYIITKCKQSKVFTFDDGTANIIEDDVYSNSSSPLSFKRLIWRLFGIKYDIDDIKALSQVHYTIYKDIPNIIDRTKFIKLFQESNSNDTDKDVESYTVKFYLGQPLTEISPEFEALNLDEILDCLNVDYYFPHPRESGHLLKSSNKILTSQLIFEDFLISYLENNPSVRVEVYSFLSSAILNIAHMRRVSVYFIYNPILFQRFREFYLLAEQKFNINILYPKNHLTS